MHPFTVSIHRSEANEFDEYIIMLTSQAYNHKLSTSFFPNVISYGVTFPQCFSEISWNLTAFKFYENRQHNRNTISINFAKVSVRYYTCKQTFGNYILERQYRNVYKRRPMPMLYTLVWIPQLERCYLNGVMLMH